MSSVTSTGVGLIDILEAVSQLSKTDVLVGVPDSGAERKDSELTNAQIGYLLENGSPATNLPPRPHLVRGVEEVQDFISQQLTKAIDAALDGNQKKMYFYLNTAGMKAMSSVKNIINEGDFIPLAPATIRNRLSRGRTSTKPLVDTGQYRNSQTYIVMDGDKEVNRAQS